MNQPKQMRKHLRKIKKSKLNPLKFMQTGSHYAKKKAIDRPVYLVTLVRKIN